MVSEWQANSHKIQHSKRARQIPEEQRGGDPHSPLVSVNPNPTSRVHTRMCCSRSGGHHQAN